MKIEKFASILLLIIFTLSPTLAQQSKDASSDDERLTSKKANSDPVYKKLRNLSNDTASFSGEYATVNNLILKKDAAIFTLKSGELYFLKEIEGRRVGAVFIGDGVLSLVPPVDSEKNSLKFFTEKTELEESFSELVVFFTDRTFEEVKNSPNATVSTNGPNASKARDAFRDKEDRLRNVSRSNISISLLRDIYAEEKNGYFFAYIKGKKYDKLSFSFNPNGSYEQVSLTNYDRNNAGSWLSFHSEDAYKNGTANSDTERRRFDILHHDIGLTIKGVRLIGTDTITLKPLKEGQRVMSFSLYFPLRVRRVFDEKNNEIIFIQESKKKDGNLAVVLPEKPAVGKTLKLRFEYDGMEALTNEGVGNYFLGPRSSWYPNNSSSAFGDRASFDLKFRYPEANQLIGSGELVEYSKNDDGKQYAYWSTKGVEMAVAGFNYGDFRKQEIHDKTTGYKLEVYTNRYLPKDLKSIVNEIENIENRAANFGGGAIDVNIGSINTASKAKTVLDEAVMSTRLYDLYFGKLPHKRIAMTQQPAGFFGQAWATLVFMPYYAFVDKTHRQQLLQNSKFWREVGPHEVAHQWWGHAVGWKSYRDQWMSEGFSEFSTSLFVQFIYKDQDRFIKYWDDQRKQIISGNPGTRGMKPYKVGPVTQGNRLSSAKAPDGRRVMYPKGAFILHMIRMLMIDPKARGMDKDKKFRAMMTDFIKTHYNQDVSTEDFKRAVEKHITPQMDLYQNGKMDWFFNQWVYGTDVPKYEMEYSLSKQKGQTILNAKITQSEVSDSFVSPVPVYVDYGRGWIELGKATIVGNKTYELKNIPLPRKPKKVAILALKDVLATKVTNKKVS